MKNRLLEIRLKLGYKRQNEFGELLGLSKSAYNMIENNKKQVALESALDIAEKLNMHVDDIFYKSEE